METFFYQAECGDAARIRFLGDDGNFHNLMIDSGYSSTFNNILKEEIENIKQHKQEIDLWIISHIHDDHIGGVVEYIAAIERGECTDIVNTWYYNSPRIPNRSYHPTALNPISSFKSIGQGDTLTEYLRLISKVPDYDITTDLPEVSINGLTITFLSPTASKLSRLRKKYPPDSPKFLERIEEDSISEATAAKGYDYHIPIERFDLTKWSEDGSPENGSSIAILITYHGKNTLWLADAHPSVITNSLKRLGYSSEKKLICDWVKVTHHGSKGNNSNELYDLIDCSNYLMSVDGVNRHYLPTKESMARIIRNKFRPNGSHYHFYFTYDNVVLRKIFNVDGEDIYQKWNFTTHFLKDKKFLKV